MNQDNFPRFVSLPNYDDPEGKYYRLTGSYLKPTRHWCLLAEIEEVAALFRWRVVAKTRHDETFTIYFHPDANKSPSTFLWKKLKKGSTIAILYPQQQLLMEDFTTGIRIEHLDSVFVFDAPLTIIIAEGAKTIKKQCFQTDCSNSDHLSCCSQCRIGCYCSKEHQISSWKNGHKETCKQMCVLKNLFQLDYEKFERFYDFHMLNVVSPMNCLPAIDVQIHPLQHLASVLKPKLPGLMAEISNSNAGKVFSAFPETVDATTTFFARMLDEAARRLTKTRPSRSNAIVDLSERDDGQMSMSAVQLTIAEQALAALPKWAVEAGSKICWMIQLQHSTIYAGLYADHADWRITPADLTGKDFMLLRHRGGAWALLFDELLYAREFPHAHHPAPLVLRVLAPCPVPHRFKDTKKTLFAPQPGHVVTVWVRADDTTHAFRRPRPPYDDEPDPTRGEPAPGSESAALPVAPPAPAGASGASAGPGPDGPEDLAGIFRALTGVVAPANPLAALFHSMRLPGPCSDSDSD
jgi:hypothetical protein